MIVKLKVQKWMVDCCPIYRDGGAIFRKLKNNVGKTIFTYDSVVRDLNRNKEEQTELANLQ